MFLGAASGRLSIDWAEARPAPILVAPPAAIAPITPPLYGAAPTRVVLNAGVTGARAAATLAVVLNETTPALLPVPARTSCTNRLAASRASAIFGRPLSPGRLMLPDRSITRTTSLETGGAGGCATWASVDAVEK